MFLPLKYISNIKVNVLIIMACTALHKCDYLFPRKIYYLLFWYFPCLKFLCDDIPWVVLQVNAQSGHDKTSVSSTRSRVCISTLSPRNCIVRVNPKNFVIVACVACLPVNETMMSINILRVTKSTGHVFQWIVLRSTNWFIYERKSNIKIPFDGFFPFSFPDILKCVARFGIICTI